VSWRVVAPAHSALPLRSVFAGTLALIGGDSTPELSAALERRFVGRRALLTDAGTSALRLAIEAACRDKSSRSVALPAWACFDVLSAALGAEVQPLFYDIDPTTLLPDAESISAVANAKPAAIVVVHPFGIAADVPELRRSLGDSIAIIEDAAQAWGSQHASRWLGGDGDFGVLSFGRGKGLTGGSGGALLQRDPVARSLPSLRGARDVFAMAVLTALTPPSLYALPARLPFLKLGETQYKPPRDAAGISQAAAAAVLAGLAAGDAASAARAIRASTLRALVEQLGGLHNITVSANAAPGWLRLPILAPDVATRDAMVASGRELGVAASYPRTLPSLARELGVAHRVLRGEQGAIAVAERLFTVPTHSRSSRGDALRLERWLRAYAARANAQSR
jgi:perosamine synthetase